ncbi:MAG TPA: GNAT family N-acetyltransferase, partial [Flavobacterium sp.]|nr:GNAT family N-acetyltransferase [Flavobacterium sp.]
MKFTNWKIERIENILPEEFYNLVQGNKSHIFKNFPITLSGCESLEKALLFLENAAEKEKNKEGYHFCIRNLETNLLIGYLCIKNISNRILRCELAYFIDKNFEGKGIISQAASQ